MPPAPGYIYLHSALGSLLLPNRVGNELISKSSPKHDFFIHTKGELAWTIAEHRSPSEAITLTRHLTDADEGRYELLGLVNECEVAMYWDYYWNHVVAANFNADGVDDLARDVPEEIRYAGREDYFAEVDFDAWD